MTPSEALAAISALLDRPGAWDGDLYGNDVQRVLDQVDTGDQGGASFTRRSLDPAGAQRTLAERVDTGGDLALWVQVDLNGRADFGGRLDRVGMVAALRYLADGIERGDVKLGRE